MKTKQPTQRIKTKSKKALDVSSLPISVPKDSALRFNITNDSWRAGFIHKFKEWYKLPTSVDIVEFLDDLDLCRPTFYEWCRDYPDIGDAYKNAKLSFASHRRRGAIFNRMNGVWAHRGIEFYDDEEMRTTLLAAEIKAKIAQAGVSEPTTFVINYNKPRIVSPEELKETVDATL